MKNITFSVIAILLIAFSVSAQENKTVKEVTTIKRVVTKVGSKVTISEVEEVEQENGAVLVANNEDENQVFSEDIKKTDDTNVLVDETVTDDQNEALIAAEKKRQEDELIKSKLEAKAKAEAERKVLAQKEKERLAAVAAYQKKLQKRSKRTGKLDRKRRRN